MLREIKGGYPTNAGLISWQKGQVFGSLAGAKEAARASEQSFGVEEYGKGIIWLKPALDLDEDEGDDNGND